MYLSRLILNPHSRQVQAEVASPYEMHRTIMRAFPDSLEQDEERVLFRLEGEPAFGGLVLLVQSLEKPDWSWFSEPKRATYLLPLAECGAGIRRNPETKSFGLEIPDGRLLSFRLRANPTVKRNGKRQGLYREAEQLDWLARKGEQGGFRIVAARTSRKDLAHGWIHKEGTTHRLELLAVQFDGILQVTGAARFQETVRRGVGSGKGLGFGLLSLAPVPR